MAKIINLGLVDYIPIYENMIKFNESRTESTGDEFWCLQHKPVFTIGYAGNYEDIVNNKFNIAVIRIDRGGQVTYHGPGQIVIYTMVNIKRLNLSIRDYVIKLENGILNYLENYSIIANVNRDNPGVYVQKKKIASIGLKLKNNGIYHGISFNLNMDLTPFESINICGHKELKATQLSDFVLVKPFEIEVKELCNQLIKSIYSE